jgi:hypothetical protein
VAANSPRLGSGRNLLWRLARLGTATQKPSAFEPHNLSAAEVEDGLVRPHYLMKGDMAAIDYAICGVNDVIAHSLTLHPQLLAERLRSHAGVHAEFADGYGDREVTRNEFGLVDRLRRFADAVDLGDCTIPDDFDVRREAFSCAAWLQDLHPIMQGEIVEREDAQNARPGRSG